MLDIEQLRNYCLQKKGTTESLPFDNETLVFKVMDKMFALIPLENYPPTISLKCDPERAIELREQYDGFITGAYHLNKTHWNALIIDGYLRNDLVRELIDHSYQLVVAKLKKADRLALQSMEDNPTNQ